MAGLLTTSAATATADPPVQMMTTTYNAFTHWFFVYQMSAALEVLLIAGLIFVFKPYIPFLISRLWTHTPVVGIMNRVRNIAPFGGFTLRNGMYRRDWRNNIMYYVKKYLGSYFFMGVPFDIVHIDRGFVQDPVMNKFIVTLSTMGYKNVQAIDDALTFNNIDPVGEEVEDERGVCYNTTTNIVANMGYDCYDSAKKNVNPSGLVNTTMVYAPKYSNIPLDSLLGYGAEISPGSIAAQVSDIIDYRMPPVEENKLFDLLPYIAIFLVIAISGYILVQAVK